MSYDKSVTAALESLWDNGEEKAKGCNSGTLTQCI